MVLQEPALRIDACHRRADRIRTRAPPAGPAVTEGKRPTREREARIRAERRFNDVRQLAKSLMFDVHDSIQDLPGSTAARKLIVQKSLQYLDSLAKESSGDISLQRELAAAYSKIGKVQAYPAAANLGDVAGAFESFRKALDIQQAIAAARPNEVDDQIALSATYRTLSDLQGAYLNDTGASLGNIRKALAISERLHRVHPYDRRVLLECASVYETLGALQGGNGTQANLGEIYEGLANLRRAGTLVQQLVNASPSDPGLTFWSARLNAFIVEQLLRMGDRSQAFRYATTARETLERLTSGNDNSTYRRALGVVYSRIGDLLLIKGQPLQALKYYRKELELIQTAASVDPRNLEARALLAGSYANLGYALTRSGRTEDGLGALRHSDSMLAKIDRVQPNAEVCTMRGLIAIWRGQALERKGLLKEALNSYSEARTIYRALIARDSRDLQERLMLAGTENRIGRVYTHLGTLPKARFTFERAAEITEPLLHGASKINVDALYSAYDTYGGLGDAWLAFAGQTAAPSDANAYRARAQTYYEKSLQTLRKIPNWAPISPNGFESPDPNLISMHLAQCNAALANDTSR